MYEELIQADRVFWEEYSEWRASLPVLEHECPTCGLLLDTPFCHVCHELGSTRSFNTSS